MTTIIGVDLKDRNETAVLFQEIITEFGCNIRTRIGLHPSDNDVCLNRGIVLLEAGDGSEELVRALRQHWEVQLMEF